MTTVQEKETQEVNLTDEDSLKIRNKIMEHQIFATHQGESVEVTPENIAKIYNANYITSFMDRIENAIDEDEPISPDDYKKAEVIYQYKWDVLERQKDRINQREQKAAEQAAEKERKETEAAEKQGIRDSIVQNVDPEHMEVKQVSDDIDDDDYEPLVVDHSTKKVPVAEEKKPTPKTTRARKTSTKAKTTTKRKTATTPKKKTPTSKKKATVSKK